MEAIRTNDNDSYDDIHGQWRSNDLGPKSIAKLEKAKVKGLDGVEVSVHKK